MRSSDWSSDVCSSDLDKRYMALVRGRWETSKKQVNAPLLKNTLRSGERMVEVTEDGKEAMTLFRVLRRFGDLATLVEVMPVTNSDESSVGKGCVSKCRFRWSPCTSKKQQYKAR